MSDANNLLERKIESLKKIVNNLIEMSNLLIFENHDELNKKIELNDDLIKEVVAINETLRSTRSEPCLNLLKEATELKEKIMVLNQQNIDVLKNANQMQRIELKAMNQKVRASHVYNNMRRQTY